MARTSILEHLSEDVEIRSSLYEARLFQEHPTWVDIRAFLEDRIRAQSLQLERPDLTLENLRYIQGIIASARDLLDLPDKIIEWIEDEQTEEGYHG